MTYLTEHEERDADDRFDAHQRTLHAPGSDWSLWESELRSDR